MDVFNVSKQLTINILAIAFGIAVICLAFWIGTVADVHGSMIVTAVFLVVFVGYGIFVTKRFKQYRNKVKKSLTKIQKNTNSSDETDLVDMPEFVELNEQIQQMQAELDDMNERCKKSEESQSHAEQKFNELHRTASNSLASARSGLTQTEEILLEYFESINNLGVTAARINESLTSAQGDMDYTSQLVDQLSQKRGHRSEKQDELLNHLENTRDILEDHRSMFEKRYDSIREMLKDFQNLKDLCNNLKLESSKLNEGESGAELEIEGLESLINELIDEIEALWAGMEEFFDEMNDQKTRLQDTELDLDDLSKDIAHSEETESSEVLDELDEIVSTMVDETSESKDILEDFMEEKKRINEIQSNVTEEFYRISDDLDDLSRKLDNSRTLSN